MDQELFIVIWRTKGEPSWNTLYDGVCKERRLAENLIEVRQSQGSKWDFGIVGGPILLHF